MMAAARASGVTKVPNILKGFVELFARERQRRLPLQLVRPAPKITTPIIEHHGDVRMRPLSVSQSRADNELRLHPCRATGKKL